MRTNIDIDDELLKQAMAATGTTTKKGAVEAALRQAVQLKNQKKILDLVGKVVWRGHDDDWFASDEEIRAKRREAERAEHRDESIPPASDQAPAAGHELS